MENSAHYCDLATEGAFIRKSLDEYFTAAQQQGVRIVHACGSVAVPAEALCLMVGHHMATVHGKQLGKVTTVVSDCAPCTTRLRRPNRAPRALEQLMLR